MVKRDNVMAMFHIAVMLAAVVFISGCAPLLVAGGAAAGYGIAKDLEDGKLIDKR